MRTDRSICAHIPFLFTARSVIQAPWDLQLLCQETEQMQSTLAGSA